MRLEALDDVLQNSVENVNTNFAVNGLLRQARLLKEGEEVRPVTERNLDGGDGGDDPCRRMTDKITSTG